MIPHKINSIKQKINYVQWNDYQQYCTVTLSEVVSQNINNRFTNN